MRLPRCVLLFAPLVLPIGAAAERPNIVRIFAGDLLRKDVGWQGSAFRAAPHFERLARESMIRTIGRLEET